MADDPARPPKAHMDGGAACTYGGLPEGGPCKGVVGGRRETGVCQGA